MQRDILNDLLAWKKSPYRKPLLLKGARQVGKTWVLKEFGKQFYENCVYISLEETSPGRPSEYSQFFEGTRNPSRIITNLALATGQQIVPNNTLIILDEIQDCPAAIGALKYFCDEAPDYHIACAGSLLGVKLTQTESAFPVGKVEFLDMYPLTFSEYLRALDAANLDEYIKQLDNFEPIPEMFAQMLTEHLQRYFATGGMPESVQRWSDTSDISQVDKVLSDLLDSYERDFAKHGGAMQFAKLSQIWSSLPSQLARENKKFIWGLVREGARAREYEDALIWLKNAGIISCVIQNSAKGVPLANYDEKNSFKVYALDIGLLRRLVRLDASVFSDKEAPFSEFKGAFAENYALQALVPQLDIEPRYWINEKPRHEIEFIVQIENTLVPIEVKSGTAIKSASLRYYTNKHSDTTPLRVRFSMRNLTLDDNTLNIPLYMAHNAVPLIKSALEQLR